MQILLCVYAAMITKHHRTVRGITLNILEWAERGGVERIKGKENERNEPIKAMNQRMDECMSIIATALYKMQFGEVVMKFKFRVISFSS